MTAIVSLETVKSIYTPSHQGFIRGTDRKFNFKNFLKKKEIAI
jgi:hypothetical protein